MSLACFWISGCRGKLKGHIRRGRQREDFFRFHSSAGGGGKKGGLGGDLIDRFGLGVRHWNHLAVPGVGIFEYFANI